MTNHRSPVIEEVVTLLRRRAAGYNSRHTSIFNGGLMAEELKEIARTVEAMADRIPDAAARSREQPAFSAAMDDMRDPEVARAMRLEEYESQPAAATPSAPRTVKSGILVLDVEGWTLSVRVHDGGYEVSITEDGSPASHYVRLDHEQADTLRDFMVETSPDDAQAAPEPHDATYLRGWNEGIERALELLEADGWACPNELIKPLLEASSIPSPQRNKEA